MVRENVQIYGIQITGKSFCKSKIESRYFYLCSLTNPPPPVSYHHPQEQSLIPPRQHFFKILFLPVESGEKLCFKFH